MPDKYVYVDPVNGNDANPSAPRANEVALTAAANPWQTLGAAEAAERTNLTTMGGSMIFRLLAGSDTATTPIIFSTTDWPGTTSSYRVQLVGYGTGVWTGSGLSGGYRTNRYIQYGEIYTHTANFYVSTTDNYATWSNGGQYQDHTIDRMYLKNTGSGGVVAQLYRNVNIKNSVLFATLGRCLNDQGFGNILVENCTLVSNNASTATVTFTSDNATTELRDCYIANIGAGAAIGSRVNAVITRCATDDATGSATLQNVAYSTSSGAYFTNVGSGTENFRINFGSVLINAATGSTQTYDAIGNTRSTPDIGAYEYVSGSAVPTITNFGDESHYATESVVITGTGYSATQGSGRVYICPTNNVDDVNRVEQTVTSWGDTSITVTVVKGAMSYNTNLYLFVINSGANANATGYITQLVSRRFLKLLTQSSAATTTGIQGVVFVAPVGGAIAGTEIGEFTGASFLSSLESGQAVLKVWVNDFGGTSLTTSDTPVVLVRNTSETTGIVSATVIEE